MAYLILLQVKQIAPFWVLGITAGSIISAYKNKLILYIPYEALEKKNLLLKCVLAALMGALSPITIYGMLPILAVLARLKIRQSVISSFITTSILINPNIFIFSFSLGLHIALLRLILSILAGVIAGLLVEAVFKDKSIYNLNGFDTVQDKGRKNMGIISSSAVNFTRAVIRTAPNLTLGIVLAAIFELYFPMDLFSNIFGRGSGLGVLFSASLGVTAYYCGGGTIPLIWAWMNEGMSIGSVMTFMITGPATKLTNLTAVKTIMPAKSFLLYLIFNMAFGIAVGYLVDLINVLIK